MLPIKNFNIVYITKQMYNCLFNKNGYPTIYMFKHWEYYVNKNNKTKYNHWKTLYNYIFDIKKC